MLEKRDDPYLTALFGKTYLWLHAEGRWSLRRVTWPHLDALADQRQPMARVNPPRQNGRGLLTARPSA